MVPLGRGLADDEGLGSRQLRTETATARTNSLPSTKTGQFRCDLNGILLCDII